MKKISQFLFAFSLLSGTFSTLVAQWSTDPSINTPVSIAANNQIEPKLVSDGLGGAIIVWQDFRTTGVPDVYVQRIDANGVTQWTANGLGICTNFSEQNGPSITTDGHGGAIVAWSDWRNGIERDIYAQRIDSTGTPVWAANGVMVVGTNDREDNQKITTDGSGGAFIAYEREDINGNFDIWMQHIDGTGATTWTSGGIAVCTTVAYKINPRVQEDGLGNVFVVWQDLRNTTDYDVYAQKVSSSGTLLGAASGIPIAVTTGSQLEPKLDPDGANGVYIAWIDSRGGAGYDIYAQRLISAGTVSWAANGVVVTAAAGNQSAHDIMSNPDVNGMVATWKDFRSGTSYDIYAQKLDASGNAAWAADGIAVNTASFDQLNPNIIEDMNGGAIIVFQDSSTGTLNVKAQRIDANGSFVWPASGIDVGTAAFDQTGMKNVSDGNGGTIIAFQDNRNASNYDIYAHHLDLNGNPIGIFKPAPESFITAYPNPFTTSFSLDPVCANCNFELRDLSGRIIFSGSEIQNRDFSSLTPGMYFISVQTPTGKSGIVKVVKQ